jgi:hypothetical protein
MYSLQDMGLQYESMYLADLSWLDNDSETNIIESRQQRLVKLLFPHLQLSSCTKERNEYATLLNIGTYWNLVDSNGLKLSVDGPILSTFGVDQDRNSAQHDRITT